MYRGWISNQLLDTKLVFNIKMAAIVKLFGVMANHKNLRKMNQFALMMVKVAGLLIFIHYLVNAIRCICPQIIYLSGDRINKYREMFFCFFH